MKEEDLDLLEKKIETILQVSCKEKIDCLVLGALGCGAWKNNPNDVARCFAKVLPKYNGIFKSIIFAIKSHTQDMNFAIFNQILNCNTVKPKALYSTL
jgi:uncharacterized protein (TIGR02452 family)